MACFASASIGVFAPAALNRWQQLVNLFGFWTLTWNFGESTAWIGSWWSLEVCRASPQMWDKQALQNHSFGGGAESAAGVMVKRSGRVLTSPLKSNEKAFCYRCRHCHWCRRCLSILGRLCYCPIAMESRPSSPKGQTTCSCWSHSDWYSVQRTAFG